MDVGNVQVEKPGNMLNPEAQTQENEEEDIEEAVKEFTQLESDALCLMIFNLPSLYWGIHLACKPEELQPFSDALKLYADKKGINPMDYFFDELPLVITGVTIYTNMKEKHKVFLEEKAKEEVIEDG